MAEVLLNTSESEEVQRLRDELEKSKQRMQKWKEKTKVGVDELRKRIVELTAKLEESRAVNNKLNERLGSMESIASHPEGTTDGPCGRSSECFSVFHVGQWVDSISDALVSISFDKSDAALDVAAGMWRELEKHKRRTAQTLRMQKKTTEALEQEMTNLRETLSGAQAELAERNAAIDCRDRALDALQNRLESLETAKAALEASQAIMASKPNAEQINIFEERLEEARECMRHEFAMRESVIFDQHRDEIERLTSLYEQDLAGLRAELEERALEAIGREDKPLVGAAVTDLCAEEKSDAAYGELLEDLKSLQEELKEAREENQKLVRELGSIKRVSTLGCGSDSGNHTDSVLNGRSKPSTLSEAHSRIAELEGDVTRLSDELCETRRRLIAARHQSTVVKDQDNSLVFEGQLATYLKFTVVQLLCSSGDTNVAKNLLPVLKTLLHLEKSDLAEIYKKNPEWVKRRL